MKAEQEARSLGLNLFSLSYFLFFIWSQKPLKKKTPSLCAAFKPAGNIRIMGEVGVNEPARW